MTERTNGASVGSPNKVEERKRNMQLRQYAFAELNKKRDPVDVVKELVAQGMEEDKAIEMVNVILDASSSAIENEPQKKGGSKMIVVGAIVMGGGFLLALISLFDNDIPLLIRSIVYFIIGLVVLLRSIYLKKDNKNKVQSNNSINTVQQVNKVSASSSGSVPPLKKQSQPEPVKPAWATNQQVQSNQPAAEEPEFDPSVWWRTIPEVLPILREILNTEFSQYSIRENVPVQELAGNASDEFQLYVDRPQQVYKAEWGKPYDFVLYENGVVKGTVMLGDGHDHRDKVKFLIAKMYAKKLGLPYISFYSTFPNEREYVVKRIKKYLNI